MSKSVLQKPQVSEALSRNAFNRSGYRNMTQSAGMLIPVFAEPCIAGTKGVINRSIFTRAAQVVAPAFPDVKQSIEFFKVPIRYLLSSWNDWKLNINDLGSTAIVPQTNGVPSLLFPDRVPCIDFGVNSSGNGFEDVVLASLPSTWSINQKIAYMHDMDRILQGLGIYRLSTLSGGAGTQRANVKNLFKIAAYNKVYYDHFRNTTYESNNPYTYNLDWLLNSSNATNCTLNPAQNATHAQVFRDMFSMKYVNYKNDYYHNFFPSLNTSVSTPVGSWSLPNDLVGASVNNINFSGQPYLDAIGASSQSSPSVVASNAASISVQQIRAIFALDKLMRASAYTPKHVRDQIKARFGVDVGDKVSSESEKLGGFDNEIVFGEVTNLAASQDNALGEIGGKGVGAKNFGSDLHFYCEEDSLIIGVSYIKPSPCYDFIEDEWDDNLLKEDFWQPEFANLGLRPVLNRFGNVIAYTIPYQRYKLGKDMNLSEFNVWRSRYSESSGTIVSTTVGGALQAFAIHSTLPQDWNSAVSAQYFKVLPEHLNPIFASNFSLTHTTSSDQFYYHLDIKFAVAANMSVHGMPRL